MGWLTGWGYRKSHVINSASGAGTNYQVRIIVHYGSGTDSGGDVYLNGHCRTDFGDVRFTSSDGTTLLDYWMESCTASDNAVFWVEVADDLSSSNATIYIYYGKADATTTSNGDNTFLFFDDFPGTSLDTTKWANLGGGTVSVSGSVLTLQGTGTLRGKIGSASFQSSEYCAIRAKVKVANNATTTDGSGLLIVIQHDKSYGSSYDRPSNGFYGSAWAQNDKTLEKAVSNSVTTLAEDKTVIIFPDTTNWYPHEIQKAGSTLKYWWNGSVILTASDTTTFTSKYVGLASRERGGATYFDWVFVRKFVDPEPSHGSWGSEQAYYTVTLTEGLGLADSVVKASSVVKSELLGLSDVYGRTWAAYRIYIEPLGLSDVVVKNVSVAKAESLGLSDVYARVWSIYRVYSELLGLKDTATKSVSAFRAERLGLVDFYSRSWTAYRVFAEPLGLSDTVSSVKLYIKALTELLGLSDVVAKAPSVVRAEGLGLLDYYSRIWSAHRTYGETLGLADKVQKAASTVKTELLGLKDFTVKGVSTAKSERLGLLDAYSRTWTAYRAFTETLGLSDTVSKLTSVPLTEHLAILDTIAKSPFTTKTERLGLADFTVKGVSVARTERLGLSDVMRKASGKTFSEALGLKDAYSRLFSVHRTFTEPLGLKDTVSKGVALHTLVEVLGLYDRVLYAPNVTVLAKLIRKYMQLVNLGGDWNE